MKNIITCSRFNCLYNTFENKCLLKVIAIDNKGNCISYRDKLNSQINTQIGNLNKLKKEINNE